MISDDDNDTAVAETQRSPIASPAEILPLLTEAKSGLALFTLDRAGLIASWTPGARAVFGWSGREVLGKSFELMFTGEDLAAGAPEKELALAAAEGQAPDVRWHLRKGGGRVFIRGATHRLLDEAGQVNGFLKAGRDFTEQFRAESALRHAQEQHRLILENVHDVALFLLDAEGVVSGWNVGPQRLTGYSEEEILGRNFRVFYPGPEREAGEPENSLARAVAEGRSESEGWRVAKNGALLWMHEILTALTDCERNLTGFVVIARDITKQRLAQKELLERERENVLLAERTRMSQELHDTLAQGFTCIRLQIELAEESLRSSPPGLDSSRQHLGRALEFARQCQQESRQTIRALRSPLFDDLSLNDALENLVQQLSESAAIIFHNPDPPLHLEPEMQRDIFRVAQEALTNAIRHSQASQITLSLEQRQGQAKLTVSDDGLGFHGSGSRPEAGFGLLGMRERAQRLGASLQIEHPARGTRVILSWSLGQGRAE